MIQKEDREREKGGVDGGGKEGNDMKVMFLTEKCRWGKMMNVSLSGT